MDVEVRNNYYTVPLAVREAVEELYKTYGERFVSWNVSESTGTYGCQGYNLWYAIKRNEHTTNYID